jgi:hypothetical protein
VISGSTRMKAGTAQKMILNMITTGAMTRLGYVYENMMVNVHMKNTKLVERGIGISLMRACNVDRESGRANTIKVAGKSVRVALVMLKAGVDKPEAMRRLEVGDGNVRRAIEDAKAVDSLYASERNITGQPERALAQTSAAKKTKARIRGVMDKFVIRGGNPLAGHHPGERLKELCPALHGRSHPHRRRSHPGEHSRCARH